MGRTILLRSSKEDVESSLMISEEGLVPQSNSSSLAKSCSASSNPCIGTDGDDDMTGDDETNSMHGKMGNDLMSGGGANDGIYGNEGDDNMNGGAGDDQMNGNEGQDTIDGGDGGDSMHGNQGNDILNGGNADDGMVGDEGNDKLKGGTGDDYILGGEGDDVIWHSTDVQPSGPDGSKDTIDCGPGIDQVFINQVSDGDQASSCETVNGQSVAGGAPTSDSDNDYVPDNTDNCPNVSNNSQMDVDGDGLGDACDSDLDIDKDGVTDLHDNCPEIYNPDQINSDHDGPGDVCTPYKIKVVFDSVTGT